MKAHVVLAAMALVAGSAVVAKAEQVDISTLTCEQVASLPPETVGMIISFIDGYTGGEAGDPVFDSDRLSSDIDAAAAACTADPTRPLMEVMQEVLGG